MDPSPILSSAFPLPPMGYIELFSDDNIRQNNKILQPPPPIQGPYECFGIYCNGIDLTEPIIRPLAAQQIQRVYMRTDDYKGELKKLCFAILTNYLDLLQIVSRSTSTPSIEHGNITLREQKLQEIELLFINIHHLINELRPHQARETLRVILEEQKQQREKTIDKLYSFLNRIVDVLNSAVYSLNDLMEPYSEIKSQILKTRSGRISYRIRNFSLSDRIDIQRLCTEERIEILTPLARSCFRNRLTFILLLLCIILMMFISSRLLIIILLPSTMITSFITYRITRLKYKIKAPFRHTFIEYTEKLSRRRILVAIIVVEDENDVMHEQDLVGFISFSSHPSERQAALITHLFVTKNYRHEKIGHYLLQTCRRVLSEETQYQSLYALCSGYQKDGYKFLLDHHFFIYDTWSTCIFVPGTTDEQKMLSTTRIAPL